MIRKFFKNLNKKNYTEMVTNKNNKSSACQSQDT